MDVERGAEMSITTQPSTKSSGLRSLKSCCGVVLTTSVIFWLLIFLIAFVGAIPLAQLIVGSLFKDECPMNYRIPIYLIVAGVTGLALVIVSMCHAYPSDSGSIVLLALNIILGLFGFAWFIAGNVWVFSAKSTVQFTNPTELNTYCHTKVYNCAFVTIILTYVFACCGGCTRYSTNTNS